MPLLSGAADGRLYINGSAIRDQDGYEDVTPDLLREWVRVGALTLVTRAEFTAAMGRELPPELTTAGDEPARYPGPSGPENVYRWDDIVRVETSRRQTRRRRGGRRRRAT